MMETIGFIGCGAMGAPIAERLIEAGYPVRLFEPRAEAMGPLVKRGGVAAASPQDAATGAEVAFACLPSPEISRAVAETRLRNKDCQLRSAVSISAIATGLR